MCCALPDRFNGKLGAGIIHLRRRVSDQTRIHQTFSPPPRAARLPPCCATTTTTTVTIDRTIGGGGGDGVSLDDARGAEGE